MSEYFTFRDTLVQNRLFLNRIVISVLLMLAASLLLVSRLIYLQVVGHEHYSTLSRDNQIKIAPLAPARGLIFDRNGEVLADNAATYSLEVVPEQTANLNQTLQELKTLLNLGDEEISRFENQRAQRKGLKACHSGWKCLRKTLPALPSKCPIFRVWKFAPD